MPFLTFYTPTYRRPTMLWKCMESIYKQTIVGDLEHIVVTDLIGKGIGGMFQEIRKYTGAVHGDYVHILADDDELASPDVCEVLRGMIHRANLPELVVVRAEKDGVVYPTANPYPPVEGTIDLGCMVIRNDIWKAHAHCYGDRYQGDFDFLNSLYKDGVNAVFAPILFERGGRNLGQAEDRIYKSAG